MACSSDRSREAIRKEARDVSGMADLRTWDTKPEVPIEGKLGIKNKVQVSSEGKSDCHGIF
jgi:hypothetical protein